MKPILAAATVSSAAGFDKLIRKHEDIWITTDPLFGNIVGWLALALATEQGRKVVMDRLTEMFHLEDGTLGNNVKIFGLHFKSIVLSMLIS